MDKLYYATDVVTLRSYASVKAVLRAVHRFIENAVIFHLASVNGGEAPSEHEVEQQMREVRICRLLCQQGGEGEGNYVYIQ